MICTTLKKIRTHNPCGEGWDRLLLHLGKSDADEDLLPLLTVLESNGLDDTLWCLRTLPECGKEWRLYAVWCARQVQHLMTDPRSITALDVAETFANGAAPHAELATAAAAAEAAALAAAWDVTPRPPGVGQAAWEAASAAAYAAQVQYPPARSAYLASRAALGATPERAALHAAHETQKQELTRIVGQV